MPASDKRVRLVRAAATVFHRKGPRESTLADVAAESGVPLGNIYYYFRSKDALANAVVEERLRELGVLMTGAEAAGEPEAQLEAYFRAFRGAGSLIVQDGCPYLCLANDLARAGADARRTGALIRVQLQWIEERFTALGHDPGAAGRAAESLLGAWQGAMALAHAVGDEGILDAALGRLFPVTEATGR